MSNNEENERKMQEVLWRFCLINKEFRRLICVGEGCGFAMGPSEMEDHLIDIHDIGKFTARRVARSVSLSMAGGYREGIPPDGLVAQKGLAVFDGLRCARCGQCKTRVFGEVEKHWYDIGHGDTKGSVVELVELQSWGDRKGGKGGYWVVRREKAAMEEAGPAEETPMEDSREMVEEAAPAEVLVEEETPAEEEKSIEEVAQAEKDAVEETPIEEVGPAQETPIEQAAPAEEMVEGKAPTGDTDLKEIPDNITEDSECWSREEEGQQEMEGREDQENLDGWEVDCFGRR